MFRYKMDIKRDLATLNLEPYNICLTSSIKPKKKILKYHLFRFSFLGFLQVRIHNYRIYGRAL